jgi:hypothetical protein
MFKLIHFYIQGYYELRSIANSNGLLLNLFPVNQTFHYIVNIKSRVGKTIETIYNYELDFEILEVEN